MRQSLSGSPSPTCSIISLGCPKNLVDSETMIGRLIEAGFTFAPEAERVDLVIINTCGFLGSARQEAIDTIREILRMKKDRLVRFVIVTGCLIPTQETLAVDFPAVDAWLGPYEEENIVTCAQSLIVGASSEKPIASQKISLDHRSRRLLTAPHVAYLKIADGCDRHCSYCLIPSIRGRFVSKPIESILEEADRLEQQGVKELVLIAQETTFWGNDLYGQPQLIKLLETLKSRKQFPWIRVLYSYPLFMSDELLALFGHEKTGSSILPYIDIPLQHCNDSILKKMNRRVGRTETEELLTRLREKIPEVILRTSMIVGFPGETPEMFEELVEFMAKWKFERAGVFEFSPEPGTIAATLPDQVPQAIRHQRFRRLYAKQERIVHNIARSWVGRVLNVIIDQSAEDENGYPMDDVVLGRTYADSPDIDPIVYVTGSRLKTGSIIPCELVDVQGLDLIAVPAID